VPVSLKLKHSYTQKASSQPLNQPLKQALKQALKQQHPITPPFAKASSSSRLYRALVLGLSIDDPFFAGINSSLHLKIKTQNPYKNTEVAATTGSCNRHDTVSKTGAGSSAARKAL
jgi:hypothetical protein